MRFNAWRGRDSFSEVPRPRKRGSLRAGGIGRVDLARRINCSFLKQLNHKLSDLSGPTVAESGVTLRNA